MARETQISYLSLISPWLFPGCHSQSSCYPQNCWRSYSDLSCFLSMPSSAGCEADGHTLWCEQHNKSPHTPGQVTQSFPLHCAHNFLHINHFFLKSLDRCSNFSWFFPLLCTLGKCGLFSCITLSRHSTNSHCPNIFLSVLWPSFSETYRSCHATIGLTLSKAGVDKWNAVSAFSQSLLKPHWATPGHRFSVISPSQSILKSHLCLETPTYIKEPWKLLKTPTFMKN